MTRLSFDVTTVKENPWAEFYNVKNAEALPEPTRRKAELQGFQAAYVSTMLKALAASDTAKGSAVSDLPEKTRTLHAFSFGAGETARFDEFQSTSQGLVDIIEPDAAFADRIDKARAALNVKLSGKQIFNRATALTCQGCHQPTGATREQLRLDIGDNKLWPESLGFVHIDENSNLSPALTDEFMPFRAAVLKDHLCKDLQAEPIQQLSRMQLDTIAPGRLVRSGGTSDLVRSLATATTPAERSLVQEAVNQEIQNRRLAERSQPGSLWLHRRSH